LKDDRWEFVLGKQLLRCGTSIGANVEESIGGISKRDFIAKLQIAYKEARETRYWLRLLIVTKPAAASKAMELKDKREELPRIIVAILEGVTFAFFILSVTSFLPFFIPPFIFLLSVTSLFHFSFY
jgi:four helix bundle protein